jgi:hypothetical protein
MFKKKKARPGKEAGFKAQRSSPPGGGLLLLILLF